MSETPLVSVVSLAYNHAKFIREMLESVVTQKTDFPYWEIRLFYRRYRKE